jgi:hypothetical protein
VYLPLVGERTRDNPNHLIWEYTDTRVFNMYALYFQRYAEYACVRGLCIWDILVLVNPLLGLITCLL